MLSVPSSGDAITRRHHHASLTAAIVGEIAPCRSQSQRSPIRCRHKMCRDRGPVSLR
jgi:hypothetical protein